MNQKKVKIRNGEFEAMVSPRAAKAYERHGWTLVDDGSSETEAPQTPETPAEPVNETTSREAE